MSAAPAEENYSLLEGRAANVGRMFLDRVAESPNREAYRYPVGDGGWRSVTWCAWPNRESGARP